MIEVANRIITKFRSATPLVTGVPFIVNKVGAYDGKNATADNKAKTHKQN